MARLHLVVEGQTEETFVREVLAPHLGESQVFADARCLTTGRKRGRAFKGGLVKYDHLRRDLMLWIREDTGPEVWFTTLIDLHRLPDDFPGRKESRSISDPLRKVAALEDHFASDLAERRFIPHIQLHEFEAMLFCDLGELARLHPARESAIRELEGRTRQSRSPEHIDSGEDTHPARRILDAVPAYAKRVDGPLVTKAIGLARIESQCEHLRGWLRKLRELGAAQEAGRATGPDSDSL